MTDRSNFTDGTDADASPAIDAPLGAPRARAPRTPKPAETAPPATKPEPLPEPPYRRGLGVRKPLLVVAVWSLLTIILGTLGLFAKDILHPEDLVIKGTPSAHALALDKAAFGESTPVTIMLEGPARALDANGPALVKRLNKIDGVSAASPWSAGAPLLMRESPNRALLIVSVNQDVIDAGRDTLPRINSRLADLPPSIDAAVAGQARFSTELVDLVFSGALKAEILAFPFLLLILLLIFRAPIAAAIPLVQGLAVIGVTTGTVTLIGLFTPVNILAQASGSIIGLALGVDYSLLLVSRYRDEVALGKTTDEAIAATMATAGRTIAFAGGILLLAAFVVMGVSFGWASMTTGTFGVALAAVFSVLAAFTLLPACLKLAGGNLEKWSIARRGARPIVAPLVARVIRHPLPAAMLAAIPLLVLCFFALGLKTGGPDLKMFKADNPMRVDMEAVAAQYGGGVMAPYEVIAQSNSSQPLTSPSDVRALGKFQDKLGDDPAVRYVLGLGTNSAQKASSAAEDAPTSLAKLDVGLGAASSGAKQVRRGLSTAGGGASQLAAANGAALAGAQTLANGFASAQSGANQLSSGIAQSASGASQLDAALAKLERGTGELRDATRQAKRTARGIVSGAQLLKSYVNDTGNAISAIDGSSAATNAIDQAISALDSLPSDVQNEPGVQSARSSLSSARGSASSSGTGDAKAKNDKVYGAVDLGISQANDALGDVNHLSSVIGTLDNGVGQIASSTGRLSGGLNKLKSGSNQLKNGMAPLAGGSQQLASGLGSLAGGSSSLAGGLNDGSKKSEKLTKGLADGQKRIDEIRERADAQGKVDLKAVGKSPYLTMALLSAQPNDQKRNLDLVLNEQNGGDATRTYIFTRELPTNKSIAPFNERVTADAAGLSKKLDAEVAVGGPGRTFLDYDRFTSSRIVWLLAILSIASFLFLLVVFRSVLLAFKAVLLNLLTVGAAMGLVALLYQGSDPLFGGPGWMEATSFFVVYSVTFALSMDYEIFMINSMRESWVRTGSNERAISEGVMKTARIVTGSALVMCVLFLAMAFTTELVSSAQLGLGLAFAIAIDATLVRLVLLPATMRLFGDANWWMPRWLERLTPNVALH